jgi:hypothetical protein
MDKSPTMFFSCDVETTHTDPREGRLLTLALQPVLWEAGSEAKVLHDHQFYVRIDQTDFYHEWFQTLTDPTSTLSWWLKQDERVQDEAFRDLSRERLSPIQAASQLIDFVEGVCAEQCVPIPIKHRVFCANPVVFDHAWFDAFWHGTVANPKPFHYRALCLRSMYFGLAAQHGWDSWGRTHEADLPHHALSDAWAQALDLKDLLDSTLPKNEANQNG